MPTQIPVQTTESWILAAKIALLASLFAAAIISGIVLTIIWAYL